MFIHFDFLTTNYDNGTITAVAASKSSAVVNENNRTLMARQLSLNENSLQIQINITSTTS